MKTVLRITIILLSIGIFSTIFFFPLSEQIPEKPDIKIVASIFPAYDFTRTLTKDTDANIKLLIKPGTDLHSYEPTPQDIIDIKESNIFIYNGGESESWVKKILNELNIDTTVIRMMDFVELKTEPSDNIINNESEEEANEYDEHIWTDPNNVIKISEAISQAIKNHSPDDTSVIQHNFDQFKTELELIDNDFHILSNTKTGKIIVADRFPFRYFVEEYGFDYLAAYPGCSEQVEVSPKTVAKLIEITKQNPKKVIFNLELSNSKIAQTIANSTGAKILTWHSVHNVSQEDFDSGKTYLDFMRNNLNNLNEALYDRPTS